jgi:hypothetical protein
MNEERLRDVEIDLATCIERLTHNHDCLEALKDCVQELSRTVVALEKTVLVKFGEMTGRELQSRRIAIALSTIISVDRGSGVILTLL